MSNLSSVLACLQTDFKVHGIIGRGTYGVVLAADNLRTGFSEALKIICPAARQTLMSISAIREISALGSTRHYNVVGAKGIIVFSDGTVCVRMSLYNGTLREIMDKHEGYYMSLSNVQYIFSQIVHGVAALASLKGMLHRDLKPVNILVRNNGNQISVADWGLCRSGANVVTHTDVPYTQDVITKWYAPPEALAGESMYDTSVDVWSLGVILAEMLSGEPLFPQLSGSRKDFIVHGIFEVLGTPVTPEDIAFFQTSCALDVTKLPRQESRLETIFKRSVPVNVMSLLKAMLAYTNRPSVADICDSDYVSSRRYAMDDVQFAALLKLHPEAVLVSESPRSAVMQRVDFDSDLEGVHFTFKSLCCWNTAIFPSDLLVKAWGHLQPSGSIVECAYVWLSAMCMSSLIDDVGDVAVCDLLIALLTLTASTTCLFRNRCNTLFVQSIDPSITETRLGAAEVAALKCSKGVIGWPPEWFPKIALSKLQLVCERVCENNEGVGVFLKEFIEE